MIRTLLLLFFTWQSSTPEALQHFQAGAEAEKSGHFSAAIVEFQKVTELEPKAATGFLRLGQAYLENGDFGETIPPLKQALQLDPDLVAAQQLLGYALLAQGYAAQAVPHLEKSDDVAALGIAELEAGKLTDSAAHLQTALAKRPNDPDLLYYFGRASGLLSKQLPASPEGYRKQALRMLSKGYTGLKFDLDVPGAQGPDPYNRCLTNGEIDGMVERMGAVCDALGDIDPRRRLSLAVQRQ